MSRLVNEAIVHCSATPTDMDIGLQEIDRWHRKRGFDGCGYHRIIRRDGEVEWGRPFSEIGAHTRGYNVYSVGICIVGGIDDDGNPDFNFTYEQMCSLANELKWMKYQFNDLKISGHRDYSDKACPCFNVGAFAEAL